MNIINLKLAVINVMMHIEEKWVKVEDIDSFQTEFLEIQLDRSTLLYILRELILNLVLQVRIEEGELLYSFREADKAKQHIPGSNK